MEDSILRLSFTVSLAVVILLFSSCKKEEEYLPAMTREGRNTLGFISSDGTFGGSVNPEDIVVNGQGNLLTFGLEKSKRVWSVTYVTSFFMQLQYDEQLQSFKFNKASFTRDNVLHKTDTGFVDFFELTYYNKTRKIVSGNFDLQVISIDSTVYSDTTYYDTLSILKLEKGRFDIRFGE